MKKTIGWLGLGAALLLAAGFPTRAFAQSALPAPSPVDRPPAPTGLGAPTPTNAAPMLTWNARPQANAVTFEVFRDATKVGETTTTSFTDASLPANGPHVYDVRARVGSVRSDPSNSVTVVYDTIAPSVPTGLAALGLPSQQPLLDWSASTDGGSGVASYNVLRDGTVIATTSATQLVDGAALVGTHSYAVAAIDAAGNVSAPGAALSVLYAPAWTADQLRDASFAGCLFGAYVNPKIPALTNVSSVSDFESQIGRRLAVNHHYHTMGDPLPDGADTDDVTAAAPRIPLDSWDPNDTWANIASGVQDDAAVIPTAEAYARFPYAVFMCFHHEFNHTPAGTPAEFQAAYAHIVSIFKTYKATNVVWVLISTDAAYNVESDGSMKISQYYPAPNTNGVSGPIVDWVGTDCYNKLDSERPWTSFSDLVASFTQWTSSLTGYPTATGIPPAMIGETGCPENPAATSALDTKPTWFQEVGAYVTNPTTGFNPIKAWLYFNSDTDKANKKGVVHDYPWYMETTSASQAAFAALGQLQVMNPNPR